jgi:hypothetical protein
MGRKLCVRGKAYDPRLIFAKCRISSYGRYLLQKVLAQIEVSSPKQKGELVDEGKERVI